MNKLMLPAIALALAPMPATAQNLLTNGSFEDYVITGSPWYVRSGVSTPGWTQIGDGVDLIHNNYTQPNPIPILQDASDGVQFLDLNQAGAIGGVEQTVAATLGQRYTLTLDVSTWATNSAPGSMAYELYDPVSLAILASGAYSASIGDGWQTLTLNAFATSSSIGVRIRQTSTYQAGMGADNVSLVAAVPEPGTWAMMIGGFGLIGGTLRSARRKAKLSAA